VVGHRSWRGCRCCHHLAQRLDDVPRRDVPGAVVHDVELFAVLIVARFGVGVGVVVDDLDCPLGVLEVHLLLLIAPQGNLLLAFPQTGRRAIAAWLLLLLLRELLCKLLDLPSLLGVVAPGVVHRAPGTTLVAAEGLPRPLVSTWATTPTSRSSSSDSGCSD
jgi:hypothetical protein